MAATTVSKASAPVPPGHVAAVPEQAARHTCQICMDDLSLHEAEALPCSHVFHAACLSRWRTTSAFERPRHHCPYRCERSLAASPAGAVVAGVIQDDVEMSDAAHDEAHEDAAADANDGGDQPAVPPAPAVNPEELGEEDDPADLFR